MVALNDELIVLVDCTVRPARVLARRRGIDTHVWLGDRPLGDLAIAVAEITGGEPIDLLALVTGPGPLLALRSCAAFVRLLAWSRSIPVVSFRSLDPMAVRLAELLAPQQRGLLLEPLGRTKAIQAEVRLDLSAPIDPSSTSVIKNVSVIAIADLVVGPDDLVGGQLRAEAGLRGACVVDIGVASDVELLDYALARWRRGALTPLGELRAWYVKESGVRRGFDVRLADGSIGRVGRTGQ